MIEVIPECLVVFPAAAAAAKSLQSCPTVCDPTDSSPPGSPVPGILQARILERFAGSFFREPFRLRDRTYVIAGGLLTTEPPGKPHSITILTVNCIGGSNQNDPQEKEMQKGKMIV